MSSKQKLPVTAREKEAYTWLDVETNKTTVTKNYPEATGRWYALPWLERRYNPVTHEIVEYPGENDWERFANAALRDYTRTAKAIERRSNEYLFGKK